MLLFDLRGSDGDGQTQGLKSGSRFKGQHNTKAAGLDVERSAAKFQAPRSTSCVHCGKQFVLAPQLTHGL
ncbi:hypothetical protein IRJ41_016189 [Triplophysa rosa]|uniref:C2H2-type domain-containing protein n=1 Tax=Triplophysa rosa TaxID=992332 RepID=A0A9W8CBA2_TRIRA|nr:hypothetical protein IRJ41_016189 [Triplophysa rosa]